MRGVLTEEEREELVRRGFVPSPSSTGAWIARRERGGGVSVRILGLLTNGRWCLTRLLGGQSTVHSMPLDLIPFLIWCEVEGLL